MSLRPQTIPPINAQRATAKSPKAVRAILEVLRAHGASTPDESLIDHMPVPKLTLRTNEEMGYCFVKGQIFHLQPSLERIGFVKTQAGLSLTYDAEKDLQYVARNIEKLCQLRGWEYELDVRGSD